jgi:phospholipase/carboxylesterase
MVTRRRFLALGIGAGGSLGLCAGAGAMACARARTDRPVGEEGRDDGRLLARPAHGSASQPKPQPKPLPPGEQRLSLGTDRDGLLYVPRDLVSSQRPAPLLLLLHGAHGASRGVTSRVGAFALADEFKTVVLAPDSRDGTWDVIRGGAFGPDVAFLDTALDHLFARLPIDPTRLAIGGFSDGASYALSLGLINGDLFTHVIAFSPGFLVADHTHGRPAIFVSHGTADEILPIDSTSRQLVPGLRNAGYTVQFREFAGPHTVPAPIAREAFEWMIGAAATAPK